MPQMKIGRPRIAFRILKATKTHSECVVNIVFFTAVMVELTRLNVMLYVHCLCYYQIIHGVRPLAVMVTLLCYFFYYDMI